MLNRNHFGKKLIICVFIIILILPAVQMNFKVWDAGSLEEKRPKIAFPEVSFATLLDGTFMEMYERYFADNFGFRDRLIKLNSKVETSIFRMSSSTKVTLGKEDFLFFNETLSDYHKEPTLNDEAIAELAGKLSKLQTDLARRDIVFLFIVGPNKNTIYPEYMPIPRKHEFGQSNYDKLTVALRSQQVNFVDLVPVLMQNKQHYQLYSKRDTHWNITGGIIAMQAILRNLEEKRSLPVVVPTIQGFRDMTADEFDGSDLNVMLGVDKTYKTARKLPIIDYGDIVDPLPPTLWYGDSFSEILTQEYQIYSPNLVFFHHGKASLQETLPQNFAGKKIVVLEVVERGIPYLVTWLDKPIIWGE